MEKEQQADLKSQLLELGKRLQREVGMAEEALREDVVAPGNITSVPTHPADQDVEGLDSEIAIAQNEELLLEQVEAALERIRVGTFGVCRSADVRLTRSAYRPFRMHPAASIALAATTIRLKNRCVVNREGSGDLTFCGSPAS